MSNHTAYKGHFVTVTEELIDGHVFEKVWLKNGVIVYPVDENNQMILIQEKRPHEQPNIRLKFVAGHLEENEDPLLAANRELQEEAGYMAQELSLLGVHRSTGTVNNTVYFVLAKKLSPSKIPNPDGEDTIVSVEKHAIHDVHNGLKDGRIPQGISTLGFYRLLDLMQ